MTKAPTLRGPLGNAVQRLGLVPGLRRARDRATGLAGRWIAAGCPAPPPASIKIAIVEGLVRASGCRRFVETGTYLGNTIEVIARLGLTCHTIEIDPTIHARARKVLGRHRNIDFILGDSAAALPVLLARIDEPTCFWLDGHYSGGVTGTAREETPISAELDAILAHPVRSHTILIDDARLFDGTHDYPHLAELLAGLERHPTYRAEVSTDIIRVLPVNPPRG